MMPFQGGIYSAWLAERLRDESPRVRFFAAMALARHGTSRRLGPLSGCFARTMTRNPYLRHAGVMGLVGLGNIDGMTKADVNGVMPAPFVKSAFSK